MAEKESEKEIHKDPNFAVICSFIGRYGELLGLPQLPFDQLQSHIENTRRGKVKSVNFKVDANNNKQTTPRKDYPPPLRVPTPAPHS